MTWQSNDPHGAQPPPDRPDDRPPLDFGAAPIPQYHPPQPGQWGPQDRPYAASPPPSQLRYAEWGERVAATLVDGVLILAGTIVVGVLTGFADALPGLTWLALTGYVAWLNGSKGQSPGKALMGLKVVRDVDGATLGGPSGLLRFFMLWLMGVLSGGLLYLVAVLWPLWGRKKQALHDKMFGAAVIAGHPGTPFGKDVFLP